MKNKLATTLDWDIQVSNLHSGNGRILNRKAIFRNDDGKLLGVFSNQYQPFTNTKLQEVCTRIEQLGDFSTQGFDEFRNGKLVLAFIKNNASGLSICDLPLNEFLVIGNSHDGSKQIYVGTSHSLIRCENQFTSTTPLLKMKHLYSNSVNEIALTIKQSYELERKQLYQTMEKLSMKRVNKELVNKLVDHLLSTDRITLLDERKKEVLFSERENLLRMSIEKEMKALGKNAFGLFNGVTWYTSHEMRNSGDSFGNATGTASRLNQMAMNFCMNV